MYFQWIISFQMFRRQVKNGFELSMNFFRKIQRYFTSVFCTQNILRGEGFVVCFEPKMNYRGCELQFPPHSLIDKTCRSLLRKSFCGRNFLPGVKLRGGELKYTTTVKFNYIESSYIEIQYNFNILVFKYIDCILKCEEVLHICQNAVNIV